MIPNLGLCCDKWMANKHLRCKNRRAIGPRGDLPGLEFQPRIR